MVFYNSESTNYYTAVLSLVLIAVISPIVWIVELLISVNNEGYYECSKAAIMLITLLMIILQVYTPTVK